MRRQVETLAPPALLESVASHVHVLICLVSLLEHLLSTPRHPLVIAHLTLILHDGLPLLVVELSVRLVHN